MIFLILILGNYITVSIIFNVFMSIGPIEIVMQDSSMSLKYLFIITLGYYFPPMVYSLKFISVLKFPTSDNFSVQKTLDRVRSFITILTMVSEKFFLGEKWINVYYLRFIKFLFPHSKIVNKSTFINWIRFSLRGRTNDERINVLLFLKALYWVSCSF